MCLNIDELPKSFKVFAPAVQSDLVHVQNKHNAHEMNGSNHYAYKDHAHYILNTEQIDFGRDTTEISSVIEQFDNLEIIPVESSNFREILKKFGIIIKMAFLQFWNL